MSPNTLFSSTRLVFHESTRKLCNVIVWRVANRFTWNSQRNEGLWRFAEKCQCNFSSSHCFHGNERNSQMECLWQNGQPLKIVTILENKSILISSQSIAPDWLGRLLPNHFGASTDIRGIYYKFQTFRYHTNIDSTRLQFQCGHSINRTELSQSFWQYAKWLTHIIANAFVEKFDSNLRSTAQRAFRYCRIDGAMYGKLRGKSKVKECSFVYEQRCTLVHRR